MEQPTKQISDEEARAILAASEAEHNQAERAEQKSIKRKRNQGAIVALVLVILSIVSVVWAYFFILKDLK